LGLSGRQSPNEYIEPLGRWGPVNTNRRFESLWTRQCAEKRQVGRISGSKGRQKNSFDPYPPACFSVDGEGGRTWTHSPAPYLSRASVCPPVPVVIPIPVNGRADQTNRGPATGPLQSSSGAHARTVFFKFFKIQDAPVVSRISLRCDAPLRGVWLRAEDIVGDVEQIHTAPLIGMLVDASQRRPGFSKTAVAFAGLP
jgi:hypothetical protein